MQNDHDDKYEPHEESEYHFSDEEVSYEVEHEPAKPAPTTQKESFIKQFTQRRLILSSVVFVVLVFAVYKVVTGPSSVPSTDITSAPPVPVVAQQTVQTVPTAPMQPAIPVQAPKPVAVAPTMPQMPANAIPAPAAPAAPVVATQAPVIPQPQTAPMTQPMYPPVTSSASASYAPVQTVITTPSGASDQALSSQREQLMAASQQAANQRIAEFAQQTTNLQSEMQQLNARVLAMETQLNQLVQVLTQQQAPAQAPAPTAPGAAPDQNEPQAIGPEAQQETGEELATRIAYNVQAIIPGRAWLKSESGDTLTVAEGDLIKNVGRVTKIDPYDGVVEINTGNRVVSLSYGNTG